MCGRYTLTCDREGLIRGLPFDELSEIRIQFKPRYNVAPGQNNPIVHLEDGKPVLTNATWGARRTGGGLVINARSETAERTRMFREAFEKGRCLVPADGFLEWRRENQTNQPYLFKREDGALFVMAGLLDEGRYVVLTRDAEGEVADIHDRMPIVLGEDDARHWLETGELGEPPTLARTKVSTRINRIENDDAECLEPAPQESFDFDAD